MRPKKEAVKEAPVLPVYNLKKNLILPGLEDLLVEVHSVRGVILKKFLQAATTYGFERVETPSLEEASLYRLFYGGDESRLSDLVTFEAGGRTLALKHSVLPSVIRAYLENKVYESSPASKWMYFDSTTRMGAKNQLKNDFEFGLEVFGTFSHLTEAQVISSFWFMFKSLGLDNLTFEVNHIGSESCQVAYQDALQSYLLGKKYELCDSCVELLDQRAIEVLRCRELPCQAVLSEAPTILDFLEESSRKHFTSILEAMDELELPYQLNPYFLGDTGLSRTNCQITYTSPDGKERIVLGSGGYHDILASRLCGKALPSFGFGATLDSIVKAMGVAGITLEPKVDVEVCLVPLGELAAKRSLKLFRDLTKENIVVYDNFGDTGVKNQLKLAETHHTPVALIMGQKEAMDETVILRDVRSGMQEMFSYDKIVDEVKKRLGK